MFREKKGGAALARRIFELVEDKAGPSCLTFLMIVLAIQVGGRAVGLGAHLTWTDETARTLFVWSVFLSLPLASKRGAMIHIKLSDQLWPAGLRPHMPRLAHFLWGVTALFLAILSSMNIYAHHEFPQLTPILGFNHNHLFLVMPFSFLMVAVRVLAFGATPTQDG